VRGKWDEGGGVMMNGSLAKGQWGGITSAWGKVLPKGDSHLGGEGGGKTWDHHTRLNG